MKRKTILTLGSSTLLSLGLLGGAATMASAEQRTDSSDMAEVQAFMAAPGSITEAIAAAETQSGGKAVSAEFESDQANAGMYEVEIVMTDGTTSTLVMNPADGSVTQMNPANADNDDDGVNGSMADEGDDEDGDGN